MNLRLGLHNAALHLLVLVWVAAGAAQARLDPGPRAALEPLRSGWLLVALAGLAGLMPLGAVLLALAVSVTAARGLLASAAALVAAWIVGAGDYSLSGPLQHKALALVAAGAALGALAGWAWSARRHARARPATSSRLGVSRDIGPSTPLKRGGSAACIG